MQILTSEVERALDANLHYLAILVTLSLPDICAAIESPNGQTSGAKYKTWVEQWFLPEYSELTSEDLYSLRCGVVHQGRFGHPNMQYARVLFTLPDPNMHFDRNILNDALNLDAKTFCETMIASVNSWFTTNQNDPNVTANLSRLVQFYAQGLAPSMVGIPLIS